MDLAKGDRPLILVVDEIPAVIRLLQLELGIQGFRVESSLVGDKTIESIETLRPDVILLEVILPGVTGIEMMERIQERFDIPVVFLTTQGNEADRLQAFELGAADYIEKPFDPIELGRRLVTLLEAGPPEDRLIVEGNLYIDLRRQLAHRKRIPISLTTNEWTFLLALSMQPREFIPTQQLIDSIWGESQPGWDVRLRRLAESLRRKLQGESSASAIIDGNPSKGWSLVADVSSQKPGT
jgi:DNA-binding response OmpR family regulator